MGTPGFQSSHKSTLLLLSQHNVAVKRAFVFLFFQSQSSVYTDFKYGHLYVKNLSRKKAECYNSLIWCRKNYGIIEIKQPGDDTIQKPK